MIRENRFTRLMSLFMEKLPADGGHRGHLMQTEKAQYDRIIFEELNITQASITEPYTDNQHRHNAGCGK